MRIIDLDYCESLQVSIPIEGGAVAYASSSSVASKGFSGSSFQTFASGKSLSVTFSGVKQTVISLPKFSFSFAATSARAYARD